MGLDEIVAAHLRAEQAEKVAKLEALLEEERLAVRREVETTRHEIETTRHEIETIRSKAEFSKALDMALQLREESFLLAKIARLTGLSEEQAKAQIKG